MIAMLALAIVVSGASVSPQAAPMREVVEASRVPAWWPDISSADSQSQTF